VKKTQVIAAQQGVMHIAGHICEGQTLDARGHDVRVTIIQGGKSINGYYYDEQALQHIARMIDGARAYADHGRSEADQQTRSVRDMVGFYKDAQHFPPGDGSPHGRVDATLHILEAPAWLWSIIQEAVALDRPDLIGLSIDIFGNWQPSEERQAKRRSRLLAACLDVVAVGLIAYDGQGAFVGADTVSIGGAIRPRTFTGTYTINPDCTGTATIVQPGRTLHSAFVLDQPLSKTITGRNLIEGVPKTITIDDSEIREALAECIATIINGIRVALERTPPELSADISDRGIVLTGGGALIKNLDKRIREETGLPVSIADDPLASVVLGTGQMLSNFKLLRKISID